MSTVLGRFILAGSMTSAPDSQKVTGMTFGQLRQIEKEQKARIAELAAEVVRYKSALIDIEDITRDELDISGGINSQANCIARNALKEGV